MNTFSADALARPETEFDLGPAAAFCANRRVLVTGAAGSIGTELSLTLARLGCAHLTMLDQFDHGLIDVVERVRRASPKAQVSDALCDIRDYGRLEHWFRRAAPDVVFHAAALKHVHLGDRHPGECVLTNLVGARNAMAAAARVGASHFVQISTDKAAAPVCVMGVTKRLAELHLAGLGLELDAPIQLRAVRFGNVMGSQGSVAPRFAAQIEAGGPLEVTDARMQRFFMTPREAVGLILSATALDDENQGGVYVMEMGEPVSILELGKKLIEKSGKRIEIAYTGLRPGERLGEQLFDEFEDVLPTVLPGVFRAAPRTADAYVSSADVAHLESLARTFDDAHLRRRLFAFLDERLQRPVRATG